MRKMKGSQTKVSRKCPGGGLGEEGAGAEARGVDKGLAGALSTPVIGTFSSASYHTVVAASGDFWKERDPRQLSPRQSFITFTRKCLRR